jgi:hypothetical protein
MSISVTQPATAGVGFTVIDELAEVGDLPVSGDIGDAYLIDGNIYIWSTTGGWLDGGAFSAVEGPTGTAGSKGWSPVFSAVTDDERRVLQVTDWVGGQGSKPDTGDYVGATGLESDIANAVDIRGGVGASGDNGTNGTDGLNAWTPVLAVVEDDERRVFEVADWIGGEGTKPDTGDYLGPAGFVADIAEAVDVRGAQGGQGIQGETGAPGSTTIDTSAPESPSEGDMWFNPTTGFLSIRYDGTWVQV